MIPRAGSIRKIEVVDLIGVGGLARLPIVGEGGLEAFLGNPKQILCVGT